MPKSTVWIATKNFHGWGCSDCGWNCPVPTLLSDSEAKSAYDRLAMGKFRAHKCEEHPARVDSGALPSVTERIRKLAAGGYKPKDAVELVLQEVRLEFRDKPGLVESAEAEAQDFLRRMREGIV
jgi:Fe-S-cluster-containing dehydrogenase component